MIDRSSDPFSRIAAPRKSVLERSRPMSARCFDGCTAGAASFRVINNEKSCTLFSGSNLSPSVFHDVEEREGANETCEVCVECLECRADSP